MPSKNTIKNWKEEDRPRERLLLNGANTLSDSELIAILLNTGSREKSATELSKELLLKANNSLTTLSSLSKDEISKIKGIGTAKAVNIKACFEIAKRLSSEVPQKKIQITSSESIIKIIAPYLENLEHEECWVFFLNRAHIIISKEKLSMGGISATIMDSKIILKKALAKLASAIIIVHNHPSGNPYPSEQDKKSTSSIRDACKILDISLLDHIIIAKDRRFSFADEDLI